MSDKVDVKLAIDYTLPNGVNAKGGSTHKVDHSTARALAHDGIVQITDAKAAELPSAQTPAGNPPGEDTSAPAGTNTTGKQKG